MDWIQFFEDNHIDYVTRGSNTKRGEASCACPWCGADDPSHHLGVSLSAENWGCLRNPAHRGRKPNFLVSALLGCSGAQAKLIVRQYSRSDPNSLDGSLISLLEITNPTVANPAHPFQTLPNHSAPFLLPSDFRWIKAKGTTAKFWKYLEGRGFDDIKKLSIDYNLRCCLTGRWKDRVIFPLYQQNHLIGWTGRALGNPVEASRYLSSSETIKLTIFNEDELQEGGELLFVVEGPFDALKLDYYGKEHDARATCVFGVIMTIDQVSIVASLCKKFKRVVLLYDKDAAGAASHVADWLPSGNVVMGQVPDKWDDPGAMSQEAVVKLVEEYKWKQ